MSFLHIGEKTTDMLRNVFWTEKKQSTDYEKKEYLDRSVKWRKPHRPCGSFYDNFNRIRLFSRIHSRKREKSTDSEGHTSYRS